MSGSLGIRTVFSCDPFMQGHYLYRVMYLWIRSRDLAGRPHKATIPCACNVAHVHKHVCRNSKAIDACMPRQLIVFDGQRMLMSKPGRPTYAGIWIDVGARIQTRWCKHGRQEIKPWPRDPHILCPLCHDAAVVVSGR